MELRKNPFNLFNKWFCNPENFTLRERHAAILCTCQSNKPDSRVVLMKYSDEGGFIFALNPHSVTARKLNHDEYASLLLYWDKSLKQILIKGKLEVVNEPMDESVLVIKKYTRKGIIQRLFNVAHKSKFRLGYINCYKLVPDHFEFIKWNMFTERVAYDLVGDTWCRS